MRFWISQLRTLFDLNKPVIPMEVYDSHGSITGNVDKVFSKWKDDFAFLFKDKNGFDDEFLASVKV